MKIALIGWNIVLTALVCFLLFKSPTSESTAELNEGSKPTLSQDSLPSDEIETEEKIVFINSDSLFEKYDMYKDLQEELLTEKIKLEGQYKKELGKLEKEYYDLREKAPFMTQTQGEAAQADLMQKQQSLLEMEQSLSSKFVKKETELVKRIKQSIEVYIEEVNQDKHYKFVLGKSNLSGILFADKSLDITDEIIIGLNAKYQESKKLK